MAENKNLILEVKDLSVVYETDEENDSMAAFGVPGAWNNAGDAQGGTRGGRDQAPYEG